MAAVVAAMTVTPLMLGVTAPAAADTPTAQVATGAIPRAVAVNPVTNKTYVANQDSGTVTVIDGATNTTTTVTVTVPLSWLAT
jgi:YVTN family beta-propeller protein